MANFEFLKNQKEYILFANAAIEAEKVYATSPAMSAVGSRKALELAVKWVYSADDSMQIDVYKRQISAYRNSGHGSQASGIKGTYGYGNHDELRL